MVGLATSGMHYTGMVAYQVEGIVTWDRGYIVASVGLAALITGTAMAAARELRKGYGALIAPALLAAAIVFLHFAGMAAITVDPMSSDSGAVITFMHQIIA